MIDVPEFRLMRLSKRCQLLAKQRGKLVKLVNYMGIGLFSQFYMACWTWYVYCTNIVAASYFNLQSVGSMNGCCRTKQASCELYVCRAPSKPMSASQKCRMAQSSLSSSDETSDTDEETDESNSSDDDNDVSVGVELPPPTLEMNVQPTIDSTPQVLHTILIMHLS